ncbi:hypothetical protein FY034_17420 (plasmid) [Trichlorobacter lovleyi]|uniref:hypothetical protein n=1 Tax=Trichlorobacter lovleyi TaxID=313985 RepID=UPI00223F09A3|nr:hypothetical protein [Trichlorobacter lovleyi]QOX80804.1 hypothetical protein FY034_17420 [Trichlorobacter lovleyi]
MAYLVKITLALDVDSDAEAADAVNEILREQQRSFTPTSCLLDYSNDGGTEVELDVENYEEGDFLNTDDITPAKRMADFLESYHQKFHEEFQDDLDNLVLDSAESAASAINNKGFEGQIRYLLNEGYTPESIMDCVGRKAEWMKFNYQEERPCQ